MTISIRAFEESGDALPQPLVHGPRQDRSSRDPRALRILAKSIYRELRHGGLAEEDVMAIAGDLLGHVATEVKDRRRQATEGPASPR